MNVWKDERAVSPVIAVILMVAITVVLAATVFVLVSDIGTQPAGPQVSFVRDNAAKSLTVSGVSDGVYEWGEFVIQGCTAPAGNDTVSAGDSLTACNGNVKVIHTPSNSLIYQTEF